MNDNGNSNPGWRLDSALRPARLRRTRSTKGRLHGRDTWSSTAASLLLFAGILSLILSGDPPAAHNSVVAWQPLSGSASHQLFLTPGGDTIRDFTRSDSMENIQPSGTVTDQLWEPAPDRAAAVVETSTVGFRLAPSEGARSWSPGALQTRVESLIRRYPWPTVLAGIGLGFILARRVR